MHARRSVRRFRSGPKWSRKAFAASTCVDHTEVRKEVDSADCCGRSRVNELGERLEMG